MSSAEGLETRVTALEYQMREFRTDAGIARVLAGAVDRDLSELRPKLQAHQLNLNALRETQLDQHERLVSVERKVDILDVKLDKLECKVDDGFAKIDDRFATMDDRFGTLENKVDDNHAQVMVLLHKLIGDTPPSTE